MGRHFIRTHFAVYFLNYRRIFPNCQAFRYFKALEIYMSMNTLSENYIVVGIGELLWDMLPSGKRAGGAPVNFAFHASQRGAYGCAISAVGRDPLGDALLKELDRYNINHLVQTVDHPTGTVEVALDAGVPQYIIHENVAWDYLSSTKEMEDLARQADVICVGTLAQRNSLTRQTTQALLRLAPDAAYKLYDINLRQQYYSREIIEETLRHVNSFKVNDDEIRLLKDMFALTGSDEDACRWFMEKYGLKLVIFTAGHRYSTVYTADQTSTIPTPTVDVVDTVGAGDSFSGVLVTELLKGAALADAHATAVQIAAEVCAHAGAWVYHPDVNASVMAPLRSKEM